jgi:hypothetical protein
MEGLLAGILLLGLGWTASFDKIISFIGVSFFYLSLPFTVDSADSSYFFFFSFSRIDAELVFA